MPEITTEYLNSQLKFIVTSLYFKSLSLEELERKCCFSRVPEFIFDTPGPVLRREGGGESDRGQL